MKSAGLIALGLSFLAAEASAQTVDAKDFSVERFQLSLDRNGILGVESAIVPRDGMWDLTLFSTFSNDPLVVRRRSIRKNLPCLAIGCSRECRYPVSCTRAGQ